MNRARAGFVQLVAVAALLLALGIGGMHYLGMEAIRFDGVLAYDPWMFALSIAVAYLLASVALFIKFARTPKTRAGAVVLRAVSGIVMGSAIAGMHYTAMHASKFYSGPPLTDHGLVFDPIWMSSVIMLFSVLILIAGIITSSSNREISLLRRALKQREKLFSLMVFAAPNGIILVDKSGAVVLVNPETCRLFGYEEPELIGRKIETLIPATYRDKHPAFVSAFMASPRSRIMGEGQELWGLRKDGAEFPVEISLNSIETDEGIQALATISDITAQFEAKAQLARQATEATLLHGVSEIVATAETIEQAYQACLDLICPNTGWQMGHVYTLADDGTGELAPTNIWYTRDPEDLEDPEEAATFQAVTMRIRFASGVGLPAGQTHLNVQQ